MAKYDIRRSLYQIRQAGYNVPKNIRDIVTEAKVKRTMARYNVTEREAQRIEIARASTFTIKPKGVTASLQGLMGATVPGSVYYRAKKADKVRRREIDRMIAAEKSIEPLQNKIDAARSTFDRVSRSGNKGLSRIYSNRIKKLTEQLAAAQDSAIGAGLYRTKKIGIPDVDAAQKFTAADTDATVTLRIIHKSLTPSRARVVKWIDTFQDNMIKAVDAYGLPVYIAEAMKDRIRGMNLFELDKLSKTDESVFDVKVYLNYAQGVDTANLLNLMSVLEMKPSDFSGYDPNKSYQANVDRITEDIAHELNNAANSDITTWQAKRTKKDDSYGVKEELGW